jgi:hypothetical protein
LMFTCTCVYVCVLTTLYVCVVCVYVCVVTTLCMCVCVCVRALNHTQAGRMPSK